MKILLTGATGYIGRRLLPHLLDRGFEIVCAVRDARRLNLEFLKPDQVPRVTVTEVDFTDLSTLENLPKNIDGAFYLIHSMNSDNSDFKSIEERSASNFSEYISGTTAKHIIYLSGIVNDEELSEHLSSRLAVENILYNSNVPLTVLRAGIIIGSGSASFEIIRDLVEKLPVMIAPKWLKTRCQPISIGNVLDYLQLALFNKSCFNQSFDIGGPDVLTYKEMLLGYARARDLKRWILTVPVLTPRLSSLWLYFVTSTSFKLARHLVDSIRNDVIASDSRIDEVVQISNKEGYQEALKRTLLRLESGGVVSSWKDSIASATFHEAFIGQREAPEFGVIMDRQSVRITQDPDVVFQNIWTIGGSNGWYYGNWLWKVRGILDKLVGGVGLRRGRRNQAELKVGDALDFWRVQYADAENRRLLLFAEMKLPGDAWLEFKIIDQDSPELLQTAIFRPRGLWGRIYWILLVPFHFFIFKGMARAIATKKKP